MGRKPKFHSKLRADGSHGFRIYCRNSASHCFLITDLPGESNSHCTQPQPMHLSALTSTPPVSTVLNAHDFSLGPSPSLRQSRCFLKGWGHWGPQRPKGLSAHTPQVHETTLPWTDPWALVYSKQLTEHKTGLPSHRHDDEHEALSENTPHPERPPNCTTTLNDKLPYVRKWGGNWHWSS